MLWRPVWLVAACVAVWAAAPAAAQFLPRSRGNAQSPSISRTDPVTFEADQLEYDRDGGTVTATGNVEAWQNDHVLRADKIVYDRNTNVAAASGHVVLVEPDGQVLFSDYAELTEGLREGVLKDMRAILAENGKLAANGARRTEGNVTELSRAVYSTCNLCAQHPERAPLWELRARSAVQDNENHKIEYRDAVFDIYGIPVAYFPYFTHPSPDQRRASGFLVPSVGQQSRLGAFLTVPYFGVLDEQSDVTLAPTVASAGYGNLQAQYRRRFNNGTFKADGGIGYDESKIQADIFASGRFSYNDTWRYGFDINRASTAKYLRDYRQENRADILTSQAFVEGFGTGAYTRLEVTAFQGLVDSIKSVKLPYALPRYQYNFTGEPDALGGQLRVTTQDYNIVRQSGTNSERVSLSGQWDRPFVGVLGEAYKLTFRADTAAYNAYDLNQQPNYQTVGTASTARAQPTTAIEVRWPFVRQGGGTQIIEPIVQLVGGPNVGRGVHSGIPNEDSLVVEFTDSNLFSLNRYPGIDRLEGGLRANVGLHANWTAGTTSVDGLVGEVFREHRDQNFLPGSGLDKRASDIVTRLSITPGPYFDLTGRARFQHDTLRPTFGDAVASGGPPVLRLGVGYFYDVVNPYTLYDQDNNAGLPAAYFVHRNEVTANASTRWNEWRANAYVRRDVNLGKMVGAGGHLTYEDECFIFDANVNQRYTSLNGDKGATLILFQITLKTVGQFGFHAS